MEKRSMFKTIFGGKKEPAQQTLTQYKSLNMFSPTFHPWSGKLYESDIARAAISTNSSNVGKLNPKHIRRSGKQIIESPDPNIERLLKRPNPYMSMYDLLYKVAAQREEQNNAFIYLRSNHSGMLEGIFPISYSSASLVETSDGELYVTFSFATGQKVTIPYRELIHLRKHFNKSDHFGDSNIETLKNTLEVINTTDQGIVNAIKNSAVLRGLLIWKQVLKPEDVKKQTDEFVKDYLNINNSGGVASTDPRFDYKELTNTPFVPSKGSMDHAKERIYSYFGTNDKIIQSKFSEDDWNAYYENTIEPVAIQLSMEFTEKLFNRRQRDAGHEIIFESNRLQYASMTTKLNLMQMVDRGALTPNEWRLAMNLAPIEGGDVAIRRLDTAPVNGDQKTSDESDDTTNKPAPTGEPNKDVDAVDKLADVANIDDETIAEVSLNGAQIQGLLAIIQSVKDGIMDYDSAIELIVAAFPFSKDKAEKILGPRPSKTKDELTEGDDEDEPSNNGNT